MNVELLRFLALTVSPSITAAARPGLTFFGIQLVCAALVYLDYVTIAPGLAWLVAAPTLVVGGCFAVLETAARHDPEVASLLRDVQFDKLSGAFGAFSSALLFSSLGLPAQESLELVAQVDPKGVLDATAGAVAAGDNTAVQVGAIGGAVVINGGLTWARGQFVEFVDDFDLGRVWAYLETGGVLAALVILPLLPLVAMSFLVLFAVALTLLALGARSARRWADRRVRVACPACDHAVRPEASLCPSCRAELTPAVVLGQRSAAGTGLVAAWRTLTRSDARGEQL